MACIRSISGLRVTNDELTQELIASYSRAFAQYLPPGPIVIGRDGRPSGIWMEKTIIETLIDCGRNVISLGIAPTPTVQLETEHSEAAGGISITASHNPSEWNGMKFLNSGGVFLNAEENHNFWEYVDSNENPQTLPKGICTVIEKPADRHINTIHDALQRLGIELSKQSNKITAVIDAVNASGSTFVPALLESLDCESVPLYCDNSGVFPHTPEPLTEHLSDLMSAVKMHSADLGIAVDPDADRLVLIDEHGKAIGEEKTIALCTMAIIRCAQQTFQDPSIAINMSTSAMSEILVHSHGWKVYRTPVGEINVVEAMKKHECLIGGEGSGGVILPACHYGRDSLIGIALIIALMKKTGKTLSALSDLLPSATMIKGKMPWSGSADEIFQNIERHFIDSALTIRKDDGIWLQFSDGWMHIRMSNTEPILRYIIECTKAESTSRYLETLLSLFAS
jgi:phosphomannomutase